MLLEHFKTSVLLMQKGRRGDRVFKPRVLGGGHLPVGSSRPVLTGSTLGKPSPRMASLRSTAVLASALSPYLPHNLSFEASNVLSLKINPFLTFTEYIQISRKQFIFHVGEPSKNCRRQAVRKSIDGSFVYQTHALLRRKAVHLLALLSSSTRRLQIQSGDR